MKPLTSYTCKLSGEHAAALRAWLQAHDYRFREVPYARFAAEKDKTNLVFYDRGKLVVQGKGTQEFIEFVLEPEILKEARLGYEAVLNPDLLMPRLGVDESGKGDFFGPLCVAGVYVNQGVVNAWKDSGIRDSKNISSDKRIRELAELIRKRITIAVNHLANLIMAFFRDGSRWGVKIDYSVEDKPLSTIGPLTLIEDLPDDFMVMNGDILCDLVYRDFYEYHVQRKNLVTVSTAKRQSKIDFGVLEADQNHKITVFIEKPTYHFQVSMGIYCINRAVIETIPPNTRYGFDNLMLDGIRDNKGYEVRPFNGDWLDIGRPEDYDYCNDNYPLIKQKLGLE